MQFGKFYEEHKKLIIIVGLIIVAFIIYRYFWEKRSIAHDLGLGWKGTEPVLIPPTESTESTPSNDRNCLNPEIQKKIADEINKKLQEINACNCDDECKKKNQPKKSEDVEKFGNDNFY